MAVNDRLKQRRIFLGLTMAEVARVVGVSEATVCRWESGNISNMRRDRIALYAEALQTTPAYIMGMADEPQPNQPNVAAVYDNSTYMIPLFHDVAAGFGSYADSQVAEYVPVFVETPGRAKNMIAIRVRGDSMYPKIEDGDTIIVYKTDEVDSGSIAVVLIDGDDAVVKKLEYDKKRAVLISINPEYQDRVFEGEEMKRLRVVGRVMKIMKDC